MNNALAIDLGGSHASVAVVHERSLLSSTEIPLDATRGLASLLPQLRETARSLLRSHSLTTSECLGVTLSLPSLVDFRKGRIASANDKFHDAPSLDLHAWCRDAFDLPLAIENDARAALLGEYYAGAGQGFSDVLMLTLGTGVGCAMLAGGQLYRTSQPQGGNLGGHIPVSLHGRACTCGAIGCMEAEASTWALPLIAKEWPGYTASMLARETSLNFKTLFAHADHGDTIAQEIADHCIHAWSVGTVGLVHAYGPELIIFGGGVMQSAERILPSLTEYVHKHAWAPAGPVAIVPAKLGNHAPLLAAVPLLQDFLKDR